MPRGKRNRIVTLQSFREKPRGSRHRFPRKRICLVDANRWAAETLQEILRAFRYDVDTFHDPDSALDAMAAIGFDVVLVAELPHPKREFILDIRTAAEAHVRALPIIVFSHAYSEALEQKMREYGAACLLPATAAPERIHDTICELLSNGQTPPYIVQADTEGPPRPRVGMLVTSARDAALQNPFVNALRPLDLHFSAGEALLAIARKPYQAFIVVEHNTDDESGGVQLVGIIRQMIDPTGTLLPIVVLSTAANATSRFTALGANRVLSLPIAESLVDCIDDLVTQTSAQDAFADYIETVPTQAAPSAAAPPADMLSPATREAATPAPPPPEPPPAMPTEVKKPDKVEDKPAKKERRNEDGPPPPPPPVLKNKVAKQLLAENGDLFKVLFPAAKDFIL